MYMYLSYEPEVSKTYAEGYEHILFLSFFLKCDVSYILTDVLIGYVILYEQRNL